ncbi:MAG: hypothetical protein OSB02_10825 [Rhodospirillaceae bacterium]|nr:hypothetical protein [Rhodospirillaceae bacterium]
MKFVVVLLLFLAPGLTAAQEARPTDPNARDLLILTEWFEGEFDNEEQRWFHTRNGGEGEPVHRSMPA